MAHLFLQILTSIAPNNVIVLFLQNISDRIGWTALNAIFTITILALFTYKFLEKRKDEFTENKTTIYDENLFFLSIPYVFWCALIVLTFQTTFLYDVLVWPLVSFFSDSDSTNTGLKFMFMSSSIFEYYQVVAWIVLAFSTVYTAYHWIMFYVIHEWGEGEDSNHYWSFKTWLLSFIIVLLMFFSILPESLINWFLWIFSDQTIKNIVSP